MQRPVSHRAGGACARASMRACASNPQKPPARPLVRAVTSVRRRACGNHVSTVRTFLNSDGSARCLLLAVRLPMAFFSR
jgi:hypothetical protein